MSDALQDSVSWDRGFMEEFHGIPRAVPAKRHASPARFAVAWH